ncbi:HAD family hydrolase [Alkalihalobacillus sp. 1P02AB]|uniref:HAD family hydrolase n=1 Tax=Alkalihalobacillus sp. 1P02AB TaxID=3132260 RepID=UPI0039A4C32A
MEINSKLVIFDLDGTLYEGTEHFDYYARHLQAKVSLEKREEFYREYEQMKEGKHLVSIGKVYDVRRDLVLTINPIDLLVTAAYRWDGEKITDEQLQTFYPGAQQFDFDNLVAIGDGWWLPFACAKHYGVNDCYSSYLATKEFMVSNDFTIEQLPGLREFLLELQKDSNIVLMTNSDREDVGRLLNELDLVGVFEHIITSAKKPTYTKGLIQHLIEQYKVKPEEVVSVGDNFINEIAPALSLGVKAIYIQPNGHDSEVENLTVVPSVTACY